MHVASFPNFQIPTVPGCPASRPCRQAVGRASAEPRAATVQKRPDYSAFRQDSASWGSALLLRAEAVCVSSLGLQLAGPCPRAVREKSHFAVGRVFVSRVVAVVAGSPDLESQSVFAFGQPGSIPRAQVLLLQNWIAGPVMLACLLPLYRARVPRGEKASIPSRGFVPFYATCQQSRRRVETVVCCRKHHQSVSIAISLFLPKGLLCQGLCENWLYPLYV